MRRHVISLILTIILLITCSGCFWDRGRGGGYGGEHEQHDREGYGERDRGGHGEHDEERH